MRAPAGSVPLAFRRIALSTDPLKIPGGHTHMEFGWELEVTMKPHPRPNRKDWEQIAEELQETADKLPPGDDKEAAKRKALQMRKAVEIRNWLTSPGMQPPR